MYGVINEHDRVIALHDNYDVCEKYAESIYASHHQKYQVVKLKKHRSKELIDLDDFYLVSIGDVYVQRQFLDIYSIATAQVIEDNNMCINTLMRFLECTSLTPKESKIIRKCIEVISNITDRDNRYTPTPEELEQFKNDYDSYAMQMSKLT